MAGLPENDHHIFSTETPLGLRFITVTRPVVGSRSTEKDTAMKKFMIALAATLGLGAAATAPAQAGSNWSVSAGVYTTAPTYYAPAPTYYAPAPTYYAPAPTYNAPALTYYQPRYYNSLPAISFSFGNTVKKHRNHGHKYVNKHRYSGHKHVNQRKQDKRQIRNLNRRIDRLENRKAKLVENRQWRRNNRH